MFRKLSQIGEFGLIEEIRKRQSAAKDVIKGIGDDTAVVSFTQNKYLLLTTDMLMEDVHFTRSMSAQEIGHKALACNISDVAAMGGRAKYALVSLGVSAQLDVKFVTNIYRGINKLAQRFDVQIVGGDTVKSSKIVINIALTGEVEKKNLVARSGAKAGDQIFVTGKLGNSFQSGHHLRFMPRQQEAQLIVKYLKPSAMIDISDGLAADLGHIMKASKVGAILEEKKIPLRVNAKIKQALYEGEDFELLFTVPKRNLTTTALRFAQKNQFQLVGQICNQENGLMLLDSRQQHTKMPLKGFKHF
ncbi:MAG: thiamine-phosphate kinase [Candidatus Omnitrophica bacterium]|nr:thiamine-phosphate kinase [Candidatus Omnitrophota bacterium]MCB9747570.1 thiamine-phosphate kinase [Candidatus Omnitrophota bacterium]